MNKFIVFSLLFFSLTGFAQKDLSLILSADFYRAQKDTTTALAYLDSISHKNYYANFVEAEIFYGMDKWNKAVRYYKQTNALKPHYADFELAKVYAKKEQSDSVLFFLKEHLISEYKKMSFTVKTEPAFDFIRGTKEWKSLSIDDSYSKEEKALEQAIYYKEKNEIDLALDILDELIADNKKNDEALYYRAKFIIVLNKDYKYAISDLKKAIKINDRDYKYHHLLADFYFRTMKYKKALESYLLAHQFYPYNLNDYLNIAKAYYRTAEYGKAINYIARFTSIDSRNVDALLLAGQIYYDKGDYPSSIDYLTNAININPRRIDVLVARGKSYLENDQYAWAGRDFNIALDLDTQNGEIWYLKGLAFLYQGKRDEACKYFKKASYLNYYRADEYLLKECQ